MFHRTNGERKLKKAAPAAVLATVLALSACGDASATEASCKQLFDGGSSGMLFRAVVFLDTPAIEGTDRTVANMNAADLEKAVDTAPDGMKPLIQALAKPLRDVGAGTGKHVQSDEFKTAVDGILDHCPAQAADYNKAIPEAKKNAADSKRIDDEVAKAASDAKKAADERAAKKAAEDAAAKAAAEAAAAAPKEYSGFGDDVVNITKHGTGAEVAIIQHTGGSNFAVHTLDSSLGKTDLLVNEIGPYSGTVLFDVRSSKGQTTALKVTAGGAWTIKLVPLTSVRKLDGSAPMTGHGDDVFYYTGPAKAATFSHNGSSNIAVHSYGTRADLLVNEIGAYTGTIVWTPGLYQVTADGDWSAIIK